MNKFIFMMAMVFCCALMVNVAEAADPELWKTYGDLYKNKSYTELLNKIAEDEKVYKSSASKNCMLYYSVSAKWRLGEIKTADQAISVTNTEANRFGLNQTADHVLFVKARTLSVMREYDKVIAVTEGATAVKVATCRATALVNKGRYAEASEVLYKYGKKNSMAKAIEYAFTAKLNERAFNYAYEAAVNGYINDAAAWITIVNKILDTDYTNTGVTPAKIKEFLNTLNRKYSRKLVKDNPTKWDELLVLVRQTLETY